MDEVVALSPEARTVTVDAGMTYGQLCPLLHSKGYALHNLASLPHISIAGAISTATHGSGEKNGNLATAVSALEIVTAAGEVVKLSRQRDGEVFRGAVVGLGALGVITKVTLDIQPTFLMRQYVYENMPLAEMKDHFDAIQSSAYSVSLFTDWQNQRISEVWLKSSMEEGQAFDAAPVLLKICPPLLNFPLRTVPSKWAFLVRGMNDCRTFAWASRQARVKSCKRNTSCPASMRSKQFWQLNDCAIKSVRT